MAEGDEDARRRRMAILAIAAVVVLFAVELAALALGSLEVAAACGAVFIVGWLVLRSVMKRRGTVF